MVCVSHSGCWLYATWPADRYLSQPPSLSPSLLALHAHSLSHTLALLSHTGALGLRVVVLWLCRRRRRRRCRCSITRSAGEALIWLALVHIQTHKVVVCHTLHDYTVLTHTPASRRRPSIGGWCWDSRACDGRAGHIDSTTRCRHHRLRHGHRSRRHRSRLRHEDPNRRHHHRRHRRWGSREQCGQAGRKSSTSDRSSRSRRRRRQQHRRRIRQHRQHRELRHRDNRARCGRDGRTRSKGDRHRHRDARSGTREQSGPDGHTSSTGDHRPRRQQQVRHRPRDTRARSGPAGHNGSSYRPKTWRSRRASGRGARRREMRRERCERRCEEREQ